MGSTLQVSEFRRGKVISYDNQEESVVIAPWPDASIHPDPCVRERKDFDQDTRNEDSEEGFLLAPPLSEYSYDGTLKKKLSDFVEVWNAIDCLFFSLSTVVCQCNSLPLLLFIV